MLSGISIRNVVLIEALDLDLSAGFSAMTGETGAGKSIILDALGMATGARSDKALVRSEAEKALCIAQFTLDKAHTAWGVLVGADIEYTPSENLILRRTITKNGRSKAYINDTPVSVKLLASVGALILEVHGQHDGRGLLDRSTHRGQLDNFAGNSVLLKSCEETYENLKVARDRVETLKAKKAKAEEDKAFLEHAITELDRLAPKIGEDESLAAERRLLQHVEGALTELDAAKQALGEDGAYEARIGQALAGLERVRTKIGEGSTNPAFIALQEASTALEKALIELEEAGSAVNKAASAFNFEPGRLNKVEERFFALRAIARKYDVSVGQLGELRQSFGSELLGLEEFDTNMDKALAVYDKSKQAYDNVTAKLSETRALAAKKLDKKVCTELPPLKMAKADFVTQITKTADGPAGRDAVHFEVRTNPGTPLGPLDKIASGGEMSRFSLAIKVALSEQTNRTMIFDEVDAGVGGAVADAVGKRLAVLSNGGQVLVVTHSPQVAACADHQFLIHKSSKGDKTITNIDVLPRERREEEIARMLAGEIITDAARAAARQLMKAS
ncbi:MAG: DNA repair protein RecN [Robiginitomaculum sp.]